jgi:hypothetical protein
MELRVRDGGRSEIPDGRRPLTALPLAPLGSLKRTCPATRGTPPGKAWDEVGYMARRL